MGWLLTATGKSADALAAFRLARADQEALAAAPEASNDARRDLAFTINRHRRPAGEDGQAVGGGGRVPPGAGDLQKLADDNPAVTDFRSDLARQPHQPRGRCWRARERQSEAEAEFRKALALYQKLADDNPAVTEFRSGLAWNHHHLGWLLWSTGKLAEAEAEYRKAMALYQKLADDNPAVTGFRRGLAQTHIDLGHVLSSMGKPAAAEAEYRKAIAIRQKLADDHPAVTDFRFRVAHSHGYLGALLSNAGKLAEAEAEQRNALALYQKLADDKPAVTDFRNYLAWNHRDSATFCRRRASWRKRRPSPARRWRCSRSWPTTTRP